MTSDVHAPTIPAARDSDELVCLFDVAKEAYETGERADPDDLAAGVPWAVALAEVHRYWQDLTFAVVMATLDALEEMGRATEGQAA